MSTKHSVQNSPTTWACLFSFQLLKFAWVLFKRPRKHLPSGISPLCQCFETTEKMLLDLCLDKSNVLNRLPFSKVAFQTFQAFSETLFGTVFAA